MLIGALIFAGGTFFGILAVLCLLGLCSAGAAPESEEIPIKIFSYFLEGGSKLNCKRCNKDTDRVITGVGADCFLVEPVCTDCYLVGLREHVDESWRMDVTFYIKDKEYKMVSIAGKKRSEEIK